MSKIKIDDLRNQLARALADYDNLRKRTEREREDFEKISSLKILFKLLPILDILRQVQKHLGDQGLAVAIADFENILKEEGIEEIKAEPGVEFDESVHEVVEAEGEEKGKAVIVEKVLSGWRFKDASVIRHAKVKVAKIKGVKK